MHGITYIEILQLWNTHNDGVVSFTWRDIYILLDVCISHVYTDQHYDSSFIQETPKYTTLQFKSYGSEWEGRLAQDTAAVEHFEKYNKSVSNPLIGMVSRRRFLRLSFKLW
jgi:hypothetical protein